MAIYLNTETVTTGALSKVVTHNLNNASAIVARVLTSWLTNIRIASRTANDVTLNFNVQAPAGAQLDIRIVG